MTVNQFIQSQNLQIADAIELQHKELPLVKHYAVFAGYFKGQPKFIANITNGVEVLEPKKLAEFTEKYAVTSIEKFDGTLVQRNNAIKRAFKRVGEKAYNLIFNNC
jgi:hypothetical protein